MAHHLITIYSTGGGPEALQAAFDNDAPNQIRALKSHEGIFEELQNDWATVPKYLSKAEYYPDFLKYFQCEIEKKGWRNVLLEYMFNGEESTQDMFSRSWCSMIHPL